MESDTILEELKENRKKLITEFEDKPFKFDFLKKHTRIFDRYFTKTIKDKDLYKTHLKPSIRFSLIAIGSYGRGELCIHSDIDFMILFDSKVPGEAKILVKDMVFPLWDLGVEVGYSVRTIRDCLSLASNDFEVLSSLLDSRLIFGNLEIYNKFLNRLHTKLINKKKKEFFAWLQEHYDKRTKKFGDGSFLLEPHLKEGIGGLRDYHYMIWYSRFLNGKDHKLKILHDKEIKQLKKYLRFLFTVRNHLHIISERKNDHLTFTYQIPISQKMGYTGNHTTMPVEHFLSELHSTMSGIKSLHETFFKEISKKFIKTTHQELRNVAPGISIINEEVSFSSHQRVHRDPHLMIKIFEFLANRRIPLSLNARRYIKEHLYLINDKLRSSHDIFQSFMNILKGPDAATALNTMYETGALTSLFPEFNEIKDRVQFDTYHIYPVGRHCIETVRYLKTLHEENDIILIDIFSEIKHQENLLLAGLFHDIGKVYKNHAEKGAKIVRGILKRVNYDRKGSDDIVFLIKNHLLLTQTATRRDIHDEKIVINCARKISTFDRLKMLYLLTFADARATGPNAWNSWISSLVQDLFFKILHILSQGELASVSATRHVEKAKSELRKALINEINNKELERYFDAMSPRYLLNTNIQDIKKHILLVRELDKLITNGNISSFLIEYKHIPSEGTWEFVFIGKDRAGLFSDIAGVLALNNINILSAHVYTWREGTIVDIFKVTPPLDPIHQDEIWNKVRSDIDMVLNGKMDLTSLLDKKATFGINQKRLPSPSPMIRIDNRTSDFFTIIEVFTDDRIGLLHLITKSIFEMGLDIKVAKIMTHGSQIADIFYVRDNLGQKIEDKSKIEKIKKGLHLVLERGRAG